MIETKITKVKYVIQFYLKDIDKWSDSDWNNGVSKSDLANMLQLLAKARESSVDVAMLMGREHKLYRLVKKTHFITTEVVNE